MRSHATDSTATWGQGWRRIKPPLVCHLQWLTCCLDAVNQILFLGAILESNSPRIIKGNLDMCASLSPHAEQLTCPPPAMQVCFNSRHNRKNAAKQLCRTQWKNSTPVFITHPVVSGRCKRIGHPRPEPGSRCLDRNRSSDFH